MIDLQALTEKILASNYSYLTALTKEEVANFENMTQAVFKERKKFHIYQTDSVKILAMASAKDILGFKDDEKIKYLSFLTDKLLKIRQKIKAENAKTNSYHSEPLEDVIRVIHQGVIRGYISFTEDQLIRFIETEIAYMDNVTYYPNASMSATIKQIEQHFNKNKAKLSPLFIETLENTKAVMNENFSVYQSKEKTKYTERINTLLFQYGDGEKASGNKPIFFGEDDELGIALNQDIKEKMTADERNTWFAVMAHIQVVTGGKPTAKFAKAAEELLKTIDNQWFKKKITQYFEAFIHHKEKEIVINYETGGTYTYYRFMSDVNKDYIKGLAWLCASIRDKDVWHLLSRVCERSFRKIPGIGPAGAAVGNACLYVLAQHHEGVNYLSRLKMRIRQSNTQAIIEKYLTEAAQKLGISTAQLEDIVNDDFELIDGKLTKQFDDYTANLSIEAIGKTTLAWFKPDGTPQKTEPSFVKEKYKEEVTDLKNAAKQIQTNLTTQRDRLDREFKLNRSLTFAHFETYFLNHGLMGFMTKKIIWEFYENDKKTVGIWAENGFVDVKNQAIDTSKCQTVRLWHPALYSLEDVRLWREYLNQHQIKQPIKQAYREIYLLTDAEINTGTYSNRMAAHILKQHQFNSLAKLRGWRYSLLGAYDKGYESDVASIEMPEYQLKAEFWVSEVNADNAWNDTGIWHYISTDQVRFLSTANGRLDNEPIPIVDVPAIVLSEILRDVDLFVGVASVGNDPQWRDGNGVVEGRYRNYWESYSFGEIGETGKIRKEIIARLLPKLKIAAVAELQDKFLVVTGKLRTYKIHLQSTNILMTPNDQYLCIVLDRKPSAEKAELFLPFEGDAGLSVILSKAFLLANDDKITDSTIISQIGRK
jgi:hypothetical protein